MSERENFMERKIGEAIGDDETDEKTWNNGINYRLYIAYGWM